MKGMRRIHGMLAVACVASTLMGCASTGERLPVSSTFSATQVGLEPAVSTRLVADQWWLALGDEQLNHLVEQALKDQPSLAVVRARVMEAQASANATRAQALPQVGATVDPSRQLFTANSIYPPPLGGHTYNMSDATVGVNWSVDLFGKQAAQWAAAKGQMYAAQADSVAASVNVAAQVVRTYVTLARVLAQRDWAAQTLAQQAQLRELTQARAKAGLDNQIDQRQSEGQSLDARVQLEVIDEQVMVLRHQLATLCGLAPDALHDLKVDLAHFEWQHLPTRLGADLLGRRADVVAARWRVEASLKEVEAAEKSFYPDVNLGAFVGYNSIGFDQAFHASSKEAGIMPAVHLPLFTAGMLRAQLHGRESEAQMAVANYNAVLLEAVRQASDAIQSEQSLQKQWQDQTQSLEAAHQSYLLQVQRFEAGIVNQLAVLHSQGQWINQQRQTADVRARVLINQVALWTALGGGYRDPASVAQSQ